MRSAVLAFLLTVPAFAQQAPPPATLAIDCVFLAQVKSHPSPALLEAVRAEADEAMQQAPVSVMEKKQVPPSGDKHDYMSLAPYWWPDPSKPNGLPYIRHDGLVNPERATISDDAYFSKVQSAVHALGLGYYFTGNEEYAAHAALLLRAWFLSPATRMNPNLNYAQAILGVNTGRDIGLIDVHGIPRLLDGITLLSNSRRLTQEDRDGLRKWIADYYDWLRTSPNGRGEIDEKNNHGSWMDQQVVGVALFLGDKDLARTVAETAKTKRIAYQIKPDGSEPEELVRTNAFGYSVFNLDALMRLAREAQIVGVDLWGYRSENGASIRAALDYLLPYAEGTKKWTYQAIHGVQADSLTEPLLLAALNYHNPAYLEAAKRLEKKPGAEILLLQEQAEQMPPAH
jgi:hypothetical protein